MCFIEEISNNKGMSNRTIVASVFRGTQTIRNNYYQCAYPDRQDRADKMQGILFCFWFLLLLFLIFPRTSGRGASEMKRNTYFAQTS